MYTVSASLAPCSDMFNWVLQWKHVALQIRFCGLFEFKQCRILSALFIRLVIDMDKPCKQTDWPIQRLARPIRRGLASSLLALRRHIQGSPEILYFLPANPASEQGCHFLCALCFTFPCLYVQLNTTGGYGRLSGNTIKAAYHSKWRHFRIVWFPDI